MKTALKWIFGIGCFLFGFIAFATSIVGGILFLIAGAFLIPPIFEKINGSGKINRTSKILVPIVMVLFAFVAIGISSAGEVGKAMDKIEKKKEEEYAKLTQEQKDSIATVERISDSLKVAEKLQKEIEEQKKNTISAVDLYANYEANEVSADENFKNKTFYVTGIVEDIKKDFMDDIYVTLKTGQMFSYVNCYVDDKEVAGQLKKGQRATFKGTCKGMVVTLVTLKDCEIAENVD